MFPHCKFTTNQEKFVDKLGFLRPEGHKFTHLSEFTETTTDTETTPESETLEVIKQAEEPVKSRKKKSQ